MKTMPKKSSKPSSARRGGAKLGQHFLMHPRIAERIVLAAKLSPDDVVLEIGPGKGMLTRILLSHVKKVIAVEADAGLAKHIEEEFASDIARGALELLFADIRTFDPELLPPGYKVVANIPYYISGDILRKFLSTRHQPSSMTLLVQKEVAVRIAREKKGSLLALSVKAYGVPTYEFTVPRGAFLPAPNVDSAVLSIRDISRNNFRDIGEESLFFELLRAGFSQKRKMLAKNLQNAGFSSEKIPLQARAEDLSLSDWLKLVQ